MNEPIWSDAAEVIDMHAEQLAMFGGPAGVRDPGLLESALGRPANKWTYGDTGLAVLAAAYGFGPRPNHAFVDGNKRIAFMTMMIFLRINGVRISPSQPQATAIMLELAAGSVGEDGLARWIRDNLPAA